jgi:hypothetical protein
MPVIDCDAILRGIAKKREQIRVLGVSEDRERAYYEQLSGPDELNDEAHDNRMFEAAVAGLNLSAEDRALVKAVLDSGDGR